MSSALVVVPNKITFPPFLPNLINFARFDLTAAQVAGAFTTPVNLLPAISGYTYFATMLMLMKTGTTAFTGPQLARVSYNNSGGTRLTTGLLVNTTVFSAATTSAYTVSCPGAIGYISSGDGAAGDIGGVGLIFNVLTGDMAAGSPCTLLLSYYVLPYLVTNLAQS